MSEFFFSQMPQRAPYPTTAPYKGRGSRRRRFPIPIHPGHVYIPLSVMEATSRVMRRFGDERRECYAWWGGSFNAGGDAQVATMYCPNIHTEFGRIQLDRHDLAALQMELRARDQVLVAELHTHPPGAGGQNEVDAAHPAATYEGFLRPWVLILARSGSSSDGPIDPKLVRQAAETLARRMQ